MRQLLIILILTTITINKNVGAEVIFYFFSGQPNKNVAENAEYIQKKCGIKVIGVTRGIREGERLIDTIKRLNRYQKDGFEIWIDPTLYDMFDIKVYPCFVLVPETFAYSRVCVGEEEIKAKKICGNLNIKYVIRRFQACKKAN